MQSLKRVTVKYYDPETQAWLIAITSNDKDEIVATVNRFENAGYRVKVYDAKGK